MARIRTVKPEFLTDSKTGTLSGVATKLFLGMLIHADDFGVLALDHLELKAKILPYENCDADIIGRLLDSEILPRGLAQVFTVPLERADPKRYLFITNFLKHQRIDRPGHPDLPGWVKSDTPSTYLQRTLANRQSTLDFAGNSTSVRRTLDEYSTNVRGGGERKGVEGMGSERRGEESAVAKIESAESQNLPLEKFPPSPEGNSPSDPTLHQLAKGMLETLNPSGGNQFFLASVDAIAAKAKDSGISEVEACTFILQKAEAAKGRGEFTKPVFWMRDGAYDHQPKRSKGDVFETGRNAAKRLHEWNATTGTASA